MVEFDFGNDQAFERPVELVDFPQFSGIDHLVPDLGDRRMAAELQQALGIGQRDRIFEFLARRAFDVALDGQRRLSVGKANAGGRGGRGKQIALLDLPRFCAASPCIADDQELTLDFDGHGDAAFDRPGSPDGAM